MEILSCAYNYIKSYKIISILEKSCLVWQHDMQYEDPNAPLFQTELSRGVYQGSLLAHHCLIRLCEIAIPNMWVAAGL